MAKAEATQSPPEKTRNHGGTPDDLFDVLAELEGRVSKAEERLEKVKLAIGGGEDANGGMVNGVQQLLVMLDQRVQEVESVALKHDIGLADRIPQDLYKGLTPSDLFREVLSGMVQATLSTHPNIMTRGQDVLRSARFSEAIKAAHQVVCTVAKTIPGVLTEEAK